MFLMALFADVTIVIDGNVLLTRFAQQSKKRLSGITFENNNIIAVHNNRLR